MRWVNYSQTANERQEKYWLAILCGESCEGARKMRDWRLSKIERYFGLTQCHKCRKIIKGKMIYCGGWVWHPACYPGRKKVRKKSLLKARRKSKR